MSVGIETFVHAVQWLAHENGFKLQGWELGNTLARYECFQYKYTFFLTDLFWKIYLTASFAFLVNKRCLVFMVAKWDRRGEDISVDKSTT